MKKAKKVEGMDNLKRATSRPWHGLVHFFESVAVFPTYQPGECVIFDTVSDLNQKSTPFLDLYNVCDV